MEYHRGDDCGAEPGLGPAHVGLPQPRAGGGDRARDHHLGDARVVLDQSAVFAAAHRVYNTLNAVGFLADIRQRLRQGST